MAGDKFALTYADTKKGYQNLWAKMHLRPMYATAAKTQAQRIVNNAARYKTVERQTKMPWFLVGLLHMRESSGNLSTYLGDGSALAGRWASFEDGAVAAINKEGLAGHLNWPISYCLWAAEVWNGLGYFPRGINSPYVWSWSTLYDKGKYTADGVYNGNFVDPQPGVAPILQQLIASNAEVAAYFQAHPEVPVSEPIIPTPVTSIPIPSVPVTIIPGSTTPDPYDALIAMLKQANRWPAATQVSIMSNPNSNPPVLMITISGNINFTVNGHSM